MSTHNRHTDWMASAGFGIMFDYLRAAPAWAGYNPQDGKLKVDSSTRKKAVDSIYIRVRKYVIFTLGQNSGLLHAKQVYMTPG